MSNYLKVAKGGCFCSSKDILLDLREYKSLSSNELFSVMASSSPSEKMACL
jgi:hypothetical protein